MQRWLPRAFFRLVAFLSAITASGVADAQPAASPTPTAANALILFEYKEPIKGTPKYPVYLEVRESLRKFQVLELLTQFLTPLRLKERLIVEVAQCGSPVRPYQRGGPATTCYEQIDEIFSIVEKMFEKTINKDLEHMVSVIEDPLLRQKRLQLAIHQVRDKVFTGTTVQVMLHNVAKAIFDILNVPVWGRVEDAADRLTAFIMLQFGDDVALKTIGGTAIFFRLAPEITGRQWTGSGFAAIGSPEAQRYFNYLCIALGGNPQAFTESWSNVIDAEMSPRSREALVGRANRCRDEYEQVRKAFNLRIMPYVDEQLAVEVRARQGDVLGRPK